MTKSPTRNRINENTEKETVHPGCDGKSCDFHFTMVVLSAGVAMPFTQGPKRAF